MDQSVEQAIKQQVLAIFAELKNKTVNVEEVLYQPIKQSRKNLGVFGDDLKMAKQLLAVLKSLVEESQIKPLLAAKSKKWNKTTGLPETVVLIRDDSKQANPELERIKNETAWEPTKMAAIAPSITKLKDTEMALAINDYLKYRPANPDRLPTRERALQLFGDEKALDNCRENKGLFNNQLQLSDLDCFYCPEPLPFQPLALFDKRLTSNKPLLIVENANTYYSCCQANQQLQQFSAIVYGKGNRLSSEAYCDSLAVLEAQFSATDVYYFGDMDTDGFLIPQRISAIRKQQGQSPLKPYIKH
ncbi:Wadjet anti-phage system protein JetD domain-containing protein [Spartinivicinus ruber]|uniref:Wadjet anti-phage system protein JetD domain-containing protein n=1 Tax=Spartinivicinus ruber TaxID=2683272 RepID=UPI0013D6B327|nr:Wadjet anti-phage system protein JetD domain-containing protein [Spartinivicinus ruber]